MLTASGREPAWLRGQRGAGSAAVLLEHGASLQATLGGSPCPAAAPSPPGASATTPNPREKSRAAAHAVMLQVA